MPCSTCGKDGHNKRTCAIKNEEKSEKIIETSETSETSEKNEIVKTPSPPVSIISEQPRKKWLPQHAYLFTHLRPVRWSASWVLLKKMYELTPDDFVFETAHTSRYDSEPHYTLIWKFDEDAYPQRFHVYYEMKGTKCHYTRITSLDANARPCNVAMFRA
jgi:hypothetical protein